MVLFWVVVAFFCVLAIVVKMFFSNKKKKKYSKNVFKAKPSYTKELLSDKEQIEMLEKTIRDDPGALDKKYDCIVIGSGMSGMLTANILSRTGKKVLVLEQHDRLGGYTHTFEEEGFEFCSGFHFFCGYNAPIFRHTFSHLSDYKLKFKPYGDRAELVFFGKDRESGKTYEFPAFGMAASKNRLIELFPKEKPGIEKFFQKCVDGTKSFAHLYIRKRFPKFLRPLVDLLTSRGRKFWSLAKFNLYEMFDECGLKDAHLKSMLCSPLYLNNTFAESTFFPIHAITVKAASRKYFPIGGSKEFAKKIAAPIVQLGGKALCCAFVDKILVEGNKAVGVRLKGGKKVFADTVVSAIGIENSRKLLPKSTQKLMKKKIKDLKLEYGGYFGYAFLGFDKSVEEMKFKHEFVSIYSQDDWDDWKAMLELKPPNFEGLEDSYRIGISFHCVSDPTWNKRHGNKSCCEVLWYVNPDWFSQWDGTTLNNRGNEYENLKAGLSDKILEVVYRFFPQMKKHLQYYDQGSTLTAEHYTQWPNGSGYGMIPHVKKYCSDWVHTKNITKFKNLYLTGMDIDMAGMNGCAISALQTAGMILNRDLVKDVNDAAQQKKKREEEKKKYK